MSPSFDTPIFFFKPYPGSTITADAVRDGFVLPRTLDEWSDFDYVGSAGPWVSDELHRRVERFKFYQRLAWSRPRVWTAPLRRVARWRLRRDVYALPIEKTLADWLRPDPALS